jgi:predicted extracellular nuclease
MAGSQARIRGIITRIDPERGFYIEEPGSDSSRKSSNAIFIEDQALSGEVKPGQVAVFFGQVAELGHARDTLTALTEISDYRVCGSGENLPESKLELPLDSRQREAVESMRVSISQNLTVADVYKLYQGELTLSALGVLRVPTEDLPPGPSAASLAIKNRDWSVHATTAALTTPALLSGSFTGGVSGVMGNKGSGQNLLLEHPLHDQRFQGDRLQLPELPGPGKDTIRLVSFNLLNFFNGDGRGGGFPAARGAKTHAEFLTQTNRLSSAIDMIQPHLLAVQELENDGFGPHSAAQSLIKLLHGSGNKNWSVIESESGRIGNDAITVGLFYRADVLEALGLPHILEGPPFNHLSRQPLAQLFRDRSTGKHFLVAANHFKSKGSCPKTGKNADQHDGQGCWNPARVDAAEAVTDWVLDLAQQAGTDRSIILGDLNSWRQNDPVRTFRQKGFTDLVERLAGLPQYSYVYFGEAGTLDYAFASEGMLGAASYAAIWHINAQWPQKMELPEPYLRSSDHDPVVVDLDFSQLHTSD